MRDLLDGLVVETEPTEIVTRRQIYVWPDHVFCEKDELEEFLHYKSDDFVRVEVPEDIQEDQLYEWVQDLCVKCLSRPKYNKYGYCKTCWTKIIHLAAGRGSDSKRREWVNKITA